MQGLIDGAKAYNLTVYPVKVNSLNLKNGFIVHMNIDGIGHWSVIHNVTNNSLSLRFLDLETVFLSMDEFNKYYTNNSVIISNNSSILKGLSYFDVIDTSQTKIQSGRMKLTVIKKDVVKKVYKEHRFNFKTFKPQYRWVTEYRYYYSYKEYYKKNEDEGEI